MDGQTALLEPEDLLKMPDGDRYELIDGSLVERKMGAEADEIAGLLLTAVNSFIRPRKLGRAYPSQTGFLCFPRDPKLVRFPDVSFVAAGRLPGDRSPEGYIKLPPDLAVEAISPNEYYEEHMAKIADYKDAKVRLIWVISPKTKTVLIRRADGTLSELDQTGTLSGEDVVPGFACPVADLFV